MTTDGNSARSGQHGTRASSAETKPRRQVARPVRRVATLGMFLALGLVLVAACGSTTPGTPQGDAGAASSDEACSQGDTRECVGPGACRGGQECGKTGWGACDCGGSSAAGASGNEAGAHLGGSGGEAGALTSGGASDSDGGEPAGVNYEPDACPATEGCFTPNLNCGGDCPRKGCTPGDCIVVSKCRMEGDAIPTFSRQLDADEAVVRLPPAAAIGGPCDCPNGPPIFAKFLSGVNSQEPSVALHYEVRLPWHLGLPTDSTLCAPAAVSQCQNHDRSSASSRLQVWTTDPNAPPVNVRVRRGACPD